VAQSEGPEFKPQYYKKKKEKKEIEGLVKWLIPITQAPWKQEIGLQF
jgi:hypothetical protein